MSTKWAIGQAVVHAKYGASVFEAFPGNEEKFQAACEANGWRAVEEPAPVERKLSPGWNWYTASGDDRCNKCHFVFAVGARFVCHGRGHGNCCGPCAEAAGAYASPEPKSEVGKPCADWCGLEVADKRVPCGVGFDLCTPTGKGGYFQHCSQGCKTRAAAPMKTAPVVEKTKPLTCTFSTGCPGAASRRRIMERAAFHCTTCGGRCDGPCEEGDEQFEQSRAALEARLPVVVPRCQMWCGTVDPTCRHGKRHEPECHGGTDFNRSGVLLPCYCTEACQAAGHPLRPPATSEPTPPPSDDVDCGGAGSGCWGFPIECPDCEGSGASSNPMVSCSRCGGDGEVSPVACVTCHQPMPATCVNCTPPPGNSGIPEDDMCDCREIETMAGLDPTGHTCWCACHWRGCKNRRCEDCGGTVEQADKARHGLGRCLPVEPPAKAEAAQPSVNQTYPEVDCLVRKGKRCHHEACYRHAAKSAQEQAPGPPPTGADLKAPLITGVGEGYSRGPGDTGQPIAQAAEPPSETRNGHERVVGRSGPGVPQSLGPWIRRNILEPIAEPAAPPVTAKLSEPLVTEADVRWSAVVDELQTALDVAKRDRDACAEDARSYQERLTRVVDGATALREQLATRDSRIAGMETALQIGREALRSSVDDFNVLVREKAALEGKLGTAEHDVAVLKARLHTLGKSGWVRAK